MIKILLWTWALPLTLWGLLVAGILRLAGQVRYVGGFRHSLVWEIVPRSWLGQWFHADPTDGTSIGGPVVLVEAGMSRRLWLHEDRHVCQQAVLGLLHPVLYAMSAATLAAIGEDWYWLNPFEIDARIAAGQEVL